MNDDLPDAVKRTSVPKLTRVFELLPQRHARTANLPGCMAQLESLEDCGRIEGDKMVTRHLISILTFPKVEENPVRRTKSF